MVMAKRSSKKRETWIPGLLRSGYQHYFLIRIMAFQPYNLKIVLSLTSRTKPPRLHGVSSRNDTHLRQSVCFGDLQPFWPVGDQI
jgi:hypothetical protein